jgi:TPR repeat protein
MSSRSNRKNANMASNVRPPMKHTRLVAFIIVIAMFHIAISTLFSQEINQRTLRRAQQGYIQDQLSLGTMYRDGSGVPVDPTRALYWFRKAANSGSPEAQLQVGTLLLLGREGERDPVHALDWFRRSASAGYAPAMYNLGIVCLREHLTQCDDGTEMISRAAKAGYAPAEVVLGNALVDGKYGLTPNFTEGVEWLKRAAKEKFPTAEYSLGLVYLAGVHAGPDVTRGVLWLQKAADQNFAPAEDVLGRLYLLGTRIPANELLAENNLSAATQHGSNISFIPLAYLHLKQRRFDRAYFDVMCLQENAKLAVAQSIREASAEKLSSEQRSILEAKAHSWKTTHQSSYEPICARNTCVPAPRLEESLDPTLNVFRRSSGLARP